jgi:hypothetical protein
MNLWKISTVGLAASLMAFAGRDAFTTADAATNGAPSPAAVGYDWGIEQPHMEQALHDLHAARRSLEAASEHRGGWRALALKHTDEAIAETERGIEYGRHHPHE